LVLFLDKPKFYFRAAKIVFNPIRINSEFTQLTDLQDFTSVLFIHGRENGLSKSALSGK
jgi:hypothetical protein